MTWVSFGSGRREAWQSPTADGAARALAERHAGTLRYCHDASAWFVWDGALWRRDRTGRVLHLIRTIARELGTDPGGETGQASGGPAFVAGAERFARGDPAFAVTAEAWDADPMRLGTPDGAIALRTGAHVAADPADGLRRSTRVAPHDTAHCPLWRGFLADTFGGDAAMVGFIQRFCGYALTGSSAEQVLVYGWGTGGNGKSVLLNTILAVMGDYARPVALATLVSADGARHGAGSVALHGARLVGVAESEGGRSSWSGRHFGRLTGDDLVPGTAASRWCGKLLVMGRAPPALSSADDAVRRRLCIVPFRHRPPCPDRHLEARLEAEWPAILRWMIEGCLAWQAEGLAPPEAVAEATADHLDGEDPLGQFLRERCDGDPEDGGRRAAASALYAAWRDWAAAAGEPAGSQRAFAAALAGRGYRRDRTDHARCYRGLSLGGLTQDAGQDAQGKTQGMTHDAG